MIFMFLLIFNIGGLFMNKYRLLLSFTKIIYYIVKTITQLIEILKSIKTSTLMESGKPFDVIDCNYISKRESCSQSIKIRIRAQSAR